MTRAPFFFFVNILLYETLWLTSLSRPCTPAKPGTEKQRPRFSIVCVKSIVQGAAVVVKGYTSYFQIKQKSGAFGRDSFTPITPPRKGRSCQTSKKRNDTLLGGTAFFTHYWTTECYLNLFLYMSELICLSSHHRFISIVDKIISPPPLPMDCRVQFASNWMVAYL